MDKMNFYDCQKYVATELLKIPEYYHKNEISGQYDVLRKSIAEIGVKSPLIINQNPERNNIIIHGVQVYKIAKELGIEELPVWCIDCSEQEEKELRISLDKRGTAQLNKESIISLIGNLSYQNFFELPEEQNSSIMNAQFAQISTGIDNTPSEAKRAIKQVMLRLSDTQKEQYERIGLKLGSKSQTDTVLLLIEFYLENVTND